MKKGCFYKILPLLVSVVFFVSTGFAIPHGIPPLKNINSRSWYFTGKVTTQSGQVYSSCIIIGKMAQHFLFMPYHSAFITVQLVNLKTHQAFNATDVFLFKHVKFTAQPLNIDFGKAGFLRQGETDRDYLLSLHLQTQQLIPITLHWQLHAKTPILPINGTGLIQLAPHKKLTYGIQPSISLQGTMTLGKTTLTLDPTQSQLWYEHNTISMSSPRQTHWIWFGLRLHNGARLLVLRLGYIHQKPIDVINYLTPEGQWLNVSNSTLTITPDLSVPLSQNYVQAFYVRIQGEQITMDAHIVSRSPNQSNIFLADGLANITGTFNGQTINGFTGFDLRGIQGAASNYFNPATHKRYPSSP